MRPASGSGASTSGAPKPPASTTWWIPTPASRRSAAPRPRSTRGTTTAGRARGHPVTCGSTDPIACPPGTRGGRGSCTASSTTPTGDRDGTGARTAIEKRPYRLARVNESPLPSFAPGPDPGSSFVDLLRRVAPHDLPGAGLERQTGAAPFEITHGTTVVAIRYAGGVVMAGDRRATAGYTIASRRIEKVFPADDLSGVAIAGAAGPAVEMVRLFQVQLEHYEKIEGEQLSLEGKANQLAQLVRANLPAAMQGFVVVPLFAGYDARRDRGRVFSYDVTGGKYEEADFQANGSGGVHARNWIKAGWREGIDRDDAIDLALRSLFAAADEDAATGGPDLVRRHLPDRRGDRRRRLSRRSPTTTSQRRAPQSAARRARGGRAGCERCRSTSRPSR